MGKGILERLSEGPVVGDGGMIRDLEKRGYSTAGPWTPEAVLEFPEAVLQLHREFVRAGADVIQTATFYTADDKLKYNANGGEVIHSAASVNEAACKLARQAANEGDCLVCGSISPIGLPNAAKDVARTEFEKQVKIFAEQDVDFVVAEFFNNVEELEICAEVMKLLKKPFALNMSIGPAGDTTGATVEDCALRMARTGADIIGTNCKFDFNSHLKVIKKMKEALKREGLHPYLMCQPYGFLCPEIEDHVYGNVDLPEHPLAMEPRTITRFDAHKFARAAFDLGVNYIGGCCGFEAYHIRAIAQELAPERRRVPPCDSMCPAFGKGYAINEEEPSRIRMSREYWLGITPGVGRPPLLSTPVDRTKK